MLALGRRLLLLMCVVCTDDLAVGARQRGRLEMPFDDTARHGVPHQHRSHHDISHNTTSAAGSLARR